MSQFGDYPAPRVISPPPEAPWQTVLTGWALAIAGGAAAFWLADASNQAAWRAFADPLDRLPRGLWWFERSAAGLWLAMVGALAGIITTTAFGMDWSRGWNWTLYRWFPDARWKIAGGCGAVTAALVALVFAFPPAGGLATRNGVIWLSRGKVFDHRTWSETRKAVMTCEMFTPHKRWGKKGVPRPYFTFEVRFAGGRRADLTYLYDRLNDENFSAWLDEAQLIAGQLDENAPKAFRRKIELECYDQMTSGLRPDLARRFGRLMADDRF